ncbi:MAG: alpha-L-fucosidase [Clostridia bacterium]|nr:alpha-L-fucosidase [Clostridia bacterium]
MTNREWYKQAKFGMFIHWGLYSLPAGEWKGQRTDKPAEWVMTYYRIPIKEYEQLAKAFNPIFFDAEEWVKLAKNAGMKYIVFTAKHQEGFAMYKSEVDKYNIVDATPFHRDVVEELAKACRKYDMKLGLYYSQELDFHEEHGGGVNYIDPWLQCDWANNWDFPDKDKKDYSILLEKKIKPQLKELLTKYGDLLCIWCDDPCEITERQSKEVYDFIKSCQPDCLVPSRVGNGLGDIHSFEDNKLPDKDFKGLGEACVTMNHTWGYKGFDNDYKSADEILRIKKKVNDHGVNLLLNVSPDYLGRIPAPQVEILKEIGKKSKTEMK